MSPTQLPSDKSHNLYSGKPFAALRTIKAKAFAGLVLLCMTAVLSLNAPANTAAAATSASLWGLTDYVWSLFTNDDGSKGKHGGSPYVESPSSDAESESQDVAPNAPAVACTQSAIVWNVPNGGSIQTAINNADSTPGVGDLINIDAGTFNEQLLINKCIFIVGAGAGSTIIQPPVTFNNTTFPGISAKTIVEIGGSQSQVSISGVTISGFMPTVPGDLYGILVGQNAFLDLSNSSVIDIRENPLSGLQRGVAIKVGLRVGSGNTIGSANLTNVTISGYQKGAIVASHANSNLSVINSTITGAGAQPTIAQNGIQVADGATATITGNTISGNLCNAGSCGPDPVNQEQSAGVIIYNSGLTSVSSNTISNNDSGYLIYGNGIGTQEPVIGNTFNNNRFFAFYLDQSSTLIKNNFITGGNNGAVVLSYAATPSNPTPPNTIVDFYANSITGASQSGIKLIDTNTSDAIVPQVTASFNRIAGNGGINPRGVDNTTPTLVSAINNFWGCNAGPANVPCDQAIGAVTFSPWLKLTGIQASPTSVAYNGTSSISGVSLRMNSANTNTYSASTHVLDGIPITYSTSPGTNGSVAPSAGSFTIGIASGTTFTATGGPIVGNQIETVAATLDSQSITTPITVIDSTAPTATITANGPNPTNAGTISFTVVFSEPVNNFTTSGVSLTGTTAPGAFVTAVTQIAPMDGTTYKVDVTGMSGAGIVTAKVIAAAANDTAVPANPNSASNSASVGYFTGSLELVVDDLSFNCLGNGAPVYPSIQTAVAAAGPNYTIRVCDGNYPIQTSNVTITQTGLTIVKAVATKPVINLQKPSSSSNSFTVSSANVTVDGLEFHYSDLPTAAGENVFSVQGTGFTAQNNDFTTSTVWSGGEVTRAFVISGSATGLNLNHNTVTNYRQPAYVSGDGSTNLGAISFNIVSGTKGWVMENAIVTMTGNTFPFGCAGCAANVPDIAVFNYPSPTYQAFWSGSNALTISANNDNAYLDLQFTGPVDDGRGVSYVDDVPTAGNGRTAGAPHLTIQNGINNTLIGGTVNVAAGYYNEDVTVNRTLKIVGNGSATTTVSGPIGGPGATFTIGASNVEISGLKVTRDGNNTTDWNKPGLNVAGIAIQGQVLSGTVVHDNIIVGMRTAVDVNNSNGHTFRNNIIDNNRTGFIFRNQTDNIVVVENTITNNWTVGILFLDGSGGSNVPVQTAANSTFTNNNISGNWYGQIVDRQSGGSLPAPGTTNLKNFQGNWYGTAAPIVTTANSTEPVYAAQIPPIGGGTASAPGGQPDIAGPASANFLYNLPLTNGTDTNVEMTPGRGIFGFQGAPIVVNSQSLAGWGFFDDYPGQGYVGSGDFAIGPNMPNALTLGSGSARLTVDANAREAFGTADYRGIRVDRMTSLKYSSYQVSANTAAAPSLQFDIDYDLTDANTAYQGRLVFEPYQTTGNNVQQSMWQRWDAMAGKWYATGGVGVSVCSQASPCLWSDIVSKTGAYTVFNNAGIRSTPNGALLFKAGGPNGSPFTGYVDNFEIGISTAKTTFDFEPGRPTVTINQALGQNDPTNVSPINFTVTFSTGVHGFDPATDLSYTGSTATGLSAVITSGADGAAVYQIAVSATGDGTVIPSVVDSAATSDPGLGGASLPSTSTDNTVTYDTTAPTVTINQAAGQGDPTNVSPVNFSVVFNEPTTDFATGDVAVTGTAGATTGVVTSTSADNMHYNVAVSNMTGAGTVIASINAGVAHDAAGNGNAIATFSDNSIVYDATAPTVTITADAATSSTSPVTFTVVFSEPVTGFSSASDVSFSGAGASGVSIMEIGPNDGTTYKVSITGMNASGTVTASVVANAAIDASTNGNTASTTALTVFTLNTTTQVVNPANLTPVLPLPSAATAWYGFNDVTNAPMAPSFITGPATPPLGSGSARLNTAANGKYLFFTTAYNGINLSDITELSYNSYSASTNLPTLQIAIDYDSTDSNAGNFQGRMVFDPADNTTSPNQAPQAAQWQHWTATNGKVWFTQAPGNTWCGISSPCLLSTARSTYPRMNIPTSSTTAGVATFGLIGFRSTAGSSAVENYVDNFTIGVNSVNKTFDFEETPPTILIDDVTVTEGNAGTVTATFTITQSAVSTLPTTVTVNTANGTATAGSDYVAVTNQTATIPAGSTTAMVSVTVNGDLLVEPNETFNVNLSNAANAQIADGQGVGTITDDDTAPVVLSINRAGTSPTNAASVSFTVTFDRSVSGVDTTDFVLATSGLSSAAVTSVTAGPSATYTVVVSTGTGSGTLGLNLVDNDSIVDGVGNPLGGTGAGNGNFTGDIYTIDKTAPTVTIDQTPAGAGGDPTSVSPVNFTVVFSDAVTGFATGDVTIATGPGTAFGTGATPLAVVTGTGPTYNVAVSGMNQTGLVTATVPANVAVDTSNNPNTASTSTDNQVTFNLTNNNVLVSPVAMVGWFGWDDNADAVIPASMVEGPTGQPLGTGSSRIRTNATGKYLFENNTAYAGTTLSQITELSYGAYANNPGNVAKAPSLQMGADFNLNDADESFQGRIVFEPYQNTTAPNQPLVQGTWQRWNALQGKFWTSRNTINGNPTPCPQSTPCTMSQLLTAFPNVGIHRGIFGVLGFRGEGSSPTVGFEGNVDAFTIGVNSVNTTFDFEAAPPTLSVANVTGAEGGTASFLVSLAGDTAQRTLPVTVLFSTSDGTATTAGNDYVAVTNQTVTFAPGTSSVSVPVTLNADMISEGSETFTVTLSQAVNAGITGTPATGTITDSSAFIAIGGTITKFTGGGGLANVTVTLNGFGITAGTTTTTNGAGAYNFNTGIAAGGDYSVTPTCPSNPTCSAYVFDPSSREYINQNAVVTNANFLAYSGDNPRDVVIPNTLQTPVLPGQPTGVGADITVPIKVASQGNENSLNFSLVYDSTKLQFLSAACAPSLSGSGCTITGPTGPSNSPTTLLLNLGAGFALPASASPATVMLVTFKATPGASTSTPLSFSATPGSRSVSDTSGVTVPADWINGVITFATGYEADIAGGTPGSSGIGNGSVSSGDVTRIQNLVAGLATPNPNVNEFQRADSAPYTSRGNGLLTSGDVTVAQRYAGGDLVGVLNPAAGPTAPIGPKPAIDGDSMTRRVDGQLAVGDVSVVSVNAAPNSTVNVDIQLVGRGTESGFGFTLDFDQTKLTLISAAEGTDTTAPPHSLIINQLQASSGKVGVLYNVANAGILSPAGLKHIIRVKFAVGAVTFPNLGNTPIRFSSSVTIQDVNDAQGNSFVTNWVDGNVNITNGTTAAGASFGGRVVSSTGAAVGSARVVLTDSTGTVWSATSNGFGYFRIDDLPGGSVYTVSVASKRYTFTPRVVTLSDSIIDMQLVAEP